MLSVITLFHQRRDLASRYLRLWEEATDLRSQPHERLFADSGSTDGTAELLRTHGGNSAASVLHENVGYARGNNLLAGKAQGEILLFLNYDVVFTEGWIGHLIRAFDGQPDLGIVGNVQLSVRSQSPDHVGIFFSRSGAPYHFRTPLETLSKLDLLPVPAVTGACLAIRRALFEQIGGFFEGYRNSYEDIELCLRARELGYEVAVATRSVIWHYIGASPGRQDREAANARLFEERCGAFARSLARYTPPELCPSTHTRRLCSSPTASHETLQVFFDRGTGLSEQDSTVHLYSRGRWNRIEIALGTPSGGRPLAIRFDPGRSSGRIRFGGFALKRGRFRTSLGFARSRELIDLATVGGTARRVEDSRSLCIESTGHDPQVMFHLADLFPAIPDDAVLEIWLWSDKPATTASPSPRPDKAQGWIASLRPSYVLVDLLRLSPGGVNGGVKVFVLELLEEIARRHRFRLSIHVVATPEVCREIAQTARHLKCHPGSSADSPGVRAAAAKAQVLYAPLGFSAFSRPELPQVSLLVDFLHRDIVGALPDVEVAIREKWFVETICRSQVLQCNSQFVVDRLHHHYGKPAAEILVVYNAVGQTRPAKRAPASATPYFLYPANDWPHKNHDRLIEAYAHYRRGSRDPWDLKLSGHFSDLGRITRSINHWDVSAGVTLLGHVPGLEFSRVFQGASALVFPSRYEGFGIPVLEAFRLGVPVICSRTASLPEVGGEACGYFDPDDTDSITAAMQRISTDPAWRSALVEAGRRRAGRFNLAVESGKLAQVFLALASSR